MDLTVDDREHVTQYFRQKLFFKHLVKSRFIKKS